MKHRDKRSLAQLLAVTLVVTLTIGWPFTCVKAIQYLINSSSNPGYMELLLDIQPYFSLEKWYIFPEGPGVLLVGSYIEKGNSDAQEIVQFSFIISGKGKEYHSWVKSSFNLTYNNFGGVWIGKFEESLIFDYHEYQQNQSSWQSSDSDSDSTASVGP